MYIMWSEDERNLGQEKATVNRKMGKEEGSKRGKQANNSRSNERSPSPLELIGWCKGNVLI